MLYATIQLNKVKNQDEWDVSRWVSLLCVDLPVFIFDCIGVSVSGHRKNNKKFVSPECQENKLGGGVNTGG